MPPQPNLRRPAAPTPDSPHRHRQPSRPRPGHAVPQPQFHTPPSHATPQIHPSSGPVQSVESMHPAAATQAAIFGLFSRGGRQRPQMMDEDDEESDDGLNDTFAQEDPRRITIDAEGNEVTLSDEEAAGMFDEEMEGGEEEEEEEEEDELMQERDRSPTPLPPNLREISSLASWTVTTHKPGCGVAALRSSNPTEYWQSDGPQPHTLSLHFFKLVAVVRIRVYLDFEMDESYTPTKMVFLAGMGGNDLVEFATWEGETPCGWVNIPLENVGGRSGGWVRKKRRKRVTRTNDKRASVSGKSKAKAASEAKLDYDYIFSDSEHPEYDEGAYEDDNDETADEDDEDDPYAGNVLKAMVIQMKIMENHQNGKDTHVRGFQVYARDDDRRRACNAPSASANGRAKRRSLRQSSVKDGEGRDAEDDGSKVIGLEEPDWMGEPVIR